MAEGALAPHSQSLRLTANLQSGLTAITVLALLSFTSASVLFSYLCYKLAWHALRRRRHGHVATAAAAAGAAARDEPGRHLRHRTDYSLGIEGIFDDDDDASSPPDKHRVGGAGGRSGAAAPETRPPNQFLVLVTNLFLADMHQGLAFLLNVQWLREGMIHVGTPACFIQGLCVSTGDLASSCFITTIAVHAYLSVVRRRLMPQRLLYLTIALVWIFVYAISTIPIAATLNGSPYGGFFVRAGPWCWMNDAYATLRLVTHYLFIFIALATTSALYMAIFIDLRRHARSDPSSSAVLDSSPSSSELHLSRTPAFLIYPVIYVLCTLPLALGRLASMTGADVPNGYMCFAGAMIASNGMFDCLLFGSTRNVIVFAAKRNVHRQATGLGTFAFMNTPAARRYGNMVLIQGGDAAAAGDDGGAAPAWSPWGRWWRRPRPSARGVSDAPEPTRRSHRRSPSRNASQESLRRPSAAIQMDTITSVVVEVDHDKDRGYRDPLSSASVSVDGTERQPSGS